VRARGELPTASARGCDLVTVITNRRLLYDRIGNIDFHRAFVPLRLWCYGSPLGMASALPHPTQPPAIYLVLIWQVDTGFNEADAVLADVMQVLEGRDYAFLSNNAAVISVRYDAEYSEIYSILNHLATKKWPPRLGFVMSPPLAGPSVWVGWMAADWPTINRITGFADAVPPPAP
jgi:hypothetical protein